MSALEICHTDYRISFCEKGLETVLRSNVKIRLHAEAVGLGSSRVRNEHTVRAGVAASFHMNSMLRQQLWTAVSLMWHVWLTLS